MGLKAIFNTIKREGYVIPTLDKYLLSLNTYDNDRAINVNAPSQAGNCLRANYYSRLLYERDMVDARTRRIFDNGTKTHERLQEYLKEAGILLMEEVPIRNDVYNIQGHTDGIIRLSSTELGVLEIKSINTNQFSQLADAKEEHKKQAMVYLFCLDERRKFLKKNYLSKADFINSEEERIEYYKSLYTHLKSGNKFTREQKLQHEIEQHLKSDEILYNTHRPIEKVIFLYEDKNTQELKEFCVEKDENLISEVINRYAVLNECIEKNILPEREGNKNSFMCRWCPYRIECWK